jgi:ABC-type multidrug transport system fused ATPase/permease subunit
MYGIFNEILDGLINIRLSKLESLFLNRQQGYLDNCAKSYLFKCYCSRWVNLRISLLGAFAVTGASIFIALDKEFIMGAIAGFSMLNSLSIATSLGQLLLAINDVEVNMASMERICEYIETNPQELPYDAFPPAKGQWPSQGKIEVRNLTVRYQPHLKSALKSVSFAIGPGEKIGVIGRTGSGKSTLTLALLRLTEPFMDVLEPQGHHIFIDEEDVEFMGLKYLRKNIGMIPQEPILFSGNIRSNMDPFNNFTNEQIIGMLGKVRILPMLKRKVEEMAQQKLISKHLEISKFRMKKCCNMR